MKDNVSLIFATIICVFVLIILPLFSLMSRQDSMSYNRVLNIVTTFVDSAKEKGYFTNDEYVDFLTELASTNNSYNVELEKHTQILIKDVTNPDAYVEDTKIYYNKSIMEELEKNQKIVFNENDEFYVKLYNTNITSASLLYSYFASVKTAPKIINIGYGGKILNSETLSAVKTDFDSYAPVITFDNIRNGAGKDNKICYDSLVISYSFKDCVQMFNILDDNDKTIYIDFTLSDFETFFRTTIFSTYGTIEKKNFKTNLTNIKSIIKSHTKLYCNGIESYKIDITNVKYEDNVITGTIKLTNIVFKDDIERDQVKVYIESGIGKSLKNITSMATYTDEFVLYRNLPKPQIAIAGPYTEKKFTTSITKSYTENESAFIRVIVNDIEDKDLSFKVLEASTGKPVDATINISKPSDTEYWLEIKVPNSSINGSTYGTFKLQASGNGVTELSNEFIYNAKYSYEYNVSYPYEKIDEKTITSTIAPSTFYYAVQVKNNNSAWRSSDLTEGFLTSVKTKVDPKLSLKNNSADFNYSMAYYSYSYNENMLYIWYKVDVKSSSASSKVQASDIIQITYSDNVRRNTNDLIKVELTGIKVPTGFTKYTSSDLTATNFYIKNNSTGDVYVWVPYTDTNISNLVYIKSKYTYTYSVSKLIGSISKYGGFYISAYIISRPTSSITEESSYYIDLPSINEYKAAAAYVELSKDEYLLTSNCYYYPSIPMYDVILYAEYTKSSKNKNLYTSNMYSEYKCRYVIYLK